MQRARIALVVFDMDGVLAHLDRARRLELLARFTSRSPERVHSALYASDFERSAESGACAPGERYLAELNRRLDADLTRAQWIAARRDAMTPAPETLAIARRIRARTPIATLTNNGWLLRESIAQLFPEAAELFGAGFLASCELGARKPDPLVFARLAERFAAAPERIVFIDDDPEYVAGARQAGLCAIRFESATALSSELRALDLL